jgi:putative nucleotidyltransferase with HDIG domain
MRTDNRTVSRPLLAFIVLVIAAGAAAIAHSLLAIGSTTMNVYVVGLAALTMASSRFAIEIPGRPATVSVSEVFVFASVLLFGPAAPVLTVALDGVWISVTQRDRRLYRALFNVAEPAISTWVAAHVFFAIAHTTPGKPLPSTTPAVALATVAMAATFFAFNSGLSAVAVALETGTSGYDFWRAHAWYLAVNYYAAASLAALAVSTGLHINFGVAVLVLPLLLLSYVAYREASGRVDEATRHIQHVEELYRASVEMLAIAVDAKDQVTHGHICRVQRHTVQIAIALGVTDARELKAIEAGALLHDVGKLAIPDHVLNKPSALTATEFDTMKKHVTMGARMLTAVDFPYPVVPIVRHHHERWDGRGYPDGLVGVEIPLGARILAVVDCFDALTSDRPYRARLAPADALDIVLSRRGTFYDPAVVDKFVELMPSLHKESAEAQGAHASVVAGLARGGAPEDPEWRPSAMQPPSIPGAVQELIDGHARHRGGEICLFAVNQQSDALHVVYATPRLRRAVAGMRSPIGSGVSGWVAANRSAIRQAQSGLDLGEFADALGLPTCVSMPVFNCADLFGVLTVYVGGNPSEATVHAAGLLAQEVGLLVARDAAAEALREIAPMSCEIAVAS